MYTASEKSNRRVNLRDDGTKVDSENRRIEDKPSKEIIYDMKTLIKSLKGQGKIEIEAFFQQI